MKDCAGKTTEPTKPITVAKQSSPMTWLMPELTTLWVKKSAPVTH